MSGIHDPRLGTELRAEFVVVRDHDDASVKSFDGSRERSQRLPIEVVGRLVEDEDVRLVPHGRRKDDLHLLPSGQRRHTVVRAKLPGQAAVLKVLLDVLGRERADVKAGPLGNLEIHRLHCLLPAHLLERLLGEVLAAVDGGSRVLDLVLVILGLVRLTATDQLRHNLLHLSDLTGLVVDELNLERLLLKLDLLVGELHGNLDETLLVLTVVGVPPPDVLIGSLVQVALNVVEGVLGDVRDTGVGVLPDVSCLRLDLADEELDHGRLAGAVLADARDAGGEGNLDGNVEERRLLVAGVREGALGHLHERLALGLDALDRTRLGELELELRLREGEVGPGRRLDLHELVEVALEGVKLQVLDLKDVGAAVVQKSGIVRHDDGGDVGEGVQVVLHPRDVDDVQVVGGLIEQKNVCLLKHGTRQSELHAPSSRKGRHGVIRLGLAVGDEADRGEDAPDLILADVQGLDLLVGEDVVDARQVRLLALNVGLDEDGTDLGHVGEALHLVVRDGPHQRGLSGVISAQETVTLTTLQLHLGVVEQNLGTVREGELAVAQLLGVVVLVLLLGNFEHLLAHDAGGLGDVLGLLVVEEALELRRDELLPLQVLHEGQVHHARGDDGGVVDDGLERLGRLGADGLLELLGHLGGVAADRDGLVGEALEALELADGVLGHLTGLGVSDAGGVRLEGGEEEGKEGSGVEGIVDELGHVVDDDGRLTLGGSLLLAEAAEQQRHNHGKGGALDGLDKGNSGHLVHDFGHLLRLGDGLDDVLGHVLDVLVADDLAGALHGGSGGRLDLLLGVPHARRDLGNDLGEGVTELLGGGVLEDGEALKGEDADLPLLLHGKFGEDDGEEGLHGEGGDVLADGQGTVLGGLLHGRALVQSLFQT
mmetsp:Transcript_14470/g.27591  ORF Transcript_14470/g.27591 Transcript_14470/m.27591 type:complete len:882 (+) Transcript_14470:386-3031(+)